ncbi:hypothetical protein DFQ14_102138 [Halopolyspora algeriensis]|uniref:H+/gluconate symporter-like permease n=1 Tax=Halopolyspora algeriensis TaxID=1500506 RepID=A0A368VWZ9_9ACTN|nr:hypothetical protein [Halopolyspora algeriensis]RCW45837.1 hypothetical protein DFQ14_102138 [Halopolyspora algeriensis]TQM55252.1 hypothetical protein FHU43_0012 [Halopolyspora algeriensis]
MEVTAAHWVYLAGVVVIIAVMIMRKNVVVPAVAATFFTAWVFTGSLPTGLSSVFNASLVAASELFSIFLIIALITALLGSLRALEADKRMIMPFQRIMRNGSLAFVIVFAVTYVISLFFWPTPAVPLIGAILLPAAIRAGLPAMGAAMAMAIAGQGMALSSDYVIQVAPGLSAVSAGVDTGAVTDRAMLLSLITGGVAIVLVFIRVRGAIAAPSEAHLTRWENTAEDGTLHTAQNGGEGSADDTVLSEEAPARRAGADSGDGTVVGTGDEARHGDRVPTSGKDDAPTLSRVPAGDVTLQQGRIATRSKTFAILVPVMFAALVGYMLLGKFTGLVEETSGGDAAGLVGGTAALLLLAVTITSDGRGCLETSATHVVDGLVFAFKAMGIVIPIAGFFFIGNADFAGRIMSLSEDARAPGFLLDLVSRAQHAIPESPVVMGIGILLVGMATGLDGSGFSGLPLTGSLAGTMGSVSEVDIETLAAIGQMGSIWTGGGTLIAWSSLLAVAGFARVPVIELARRLFLPVVTGLTVATVAGVLLL